MSSSLDKTADILARLERVEAAIGIGHNGGPPLDDEPPVEFELDRRLAAVEVAKRYAVRVRTITRWLEQPGMNFPAPEKINHRRYWWLSQLKRWDSDRLTQSIKSKRKAGPAKAPP
jgi:hypothetical protein